MPIGYANSAATAEYNINSQRGVDFINSAPTGSRLSGADGSSWIKNSDGSVGISRGNDSWKVASPLGDLQSALDRINRISSDNSARSAAYAQEQRDWSAAQAQIANNFSAAEAAKNRDWQEFMSNSAHQREIRDLKAAGLNPILSATGGNGASTTSGATASAYMPSGATAQPDMSANSAIVGILGAMLSAQTQLAAADVSARTQEAVADKYNAMSEIVARINADVARRNADVSASASKYAADSSANASKYSADKGYSASKYASNISARNVDKQLDFQKNHPNNIFGLASELLSGADLSFSGISKSIAGLLGSLFG